MTLHIRRNVPRIRTRYISRTNRLGSSINGCTNTARHKRAASILKMTLKGIFTLPARFRIRIARTMHTSIGT